MSILLSPFLARAIALISATPDPVAFRLGPIPVHWYGVCYAVGLAAAYVVITREHGGAGWTPTSSTTGSSSWRSRR